MRHVVNPRQTGLFDPFRDILSPVAYRRIERGRQGVFRHVSLELMPVKALAGEFSPNMGTPTKELYSMAGLLFIKEFKDWTATRAAKAYIASQRGEGFPFSGTGAEGRSREQQSSNAP